MQDPRIPRMVNGYAVRPCVRSGLCCTKGPCAFGDWDFEARRCRHLGEEKREGFTLYSCGIKEQIEALPPEAGAAINPAFGAGCCMPLFNENREAIIADIVRTLSLPE